ncbi:hypothetical protein PARMER_00294 [Parabacteroides merdae ATCC 43184]|nr:hypothetical protein PARMER_00294 [Parabacteroides merdae ATCC 43184]
MNLNRYQQLYLANETPRFICNMTRNLIDFRKNHIYN